MSIFIEWKRDFAVETDLGAISGLFGLFVSIAPSTEAYRLWASAKDLGQIVRAEI